MRSADHDPEYDCQTEAAHNLAADQRQRQNRENHRQRRRDRSAEGLIDAEVDQLPQRHGSVFAEIFPDAVVDHDLIGDRVTDKS